VVFDNTFDSFFPNDTDFHMVTITGDNSSSGTCKIYLDNTLKQSVSRSNAGSDTSAQESLNLFREADGSPYWNGTLDEISLWNRVLTSDERSALYNSGSGAVTTTAVTNSTGLKAYYNMNESSGDIINQAKATCPNDFSTTSALEALTGTRTNSIFQQTDDTPTYWWYNGTSWLLDGSTGVIPTNSSTGWTFKNASDSSETSNSYIKIENGKLTFNDPTSLSYRYAYYDLGSVSDTAWVLRFKWDLETYTKGTNGGVENGLGIGLQSEAVNGFYEVATGTQATTDAFWFASFFSNGEAWTGGNYANEQSIYSGTDVKDIKSPNNMLSAGTYYIEIARTGAGTGTVKCFTGSDYSTGQVGSTCALVGTNISNLRYFVVYTGSDSSSNGVLTSTISDIQFLNNVTEFPQ